MVGVLRERTIRRQAQLHTAPRQPTLKSGLGQHNPKGNSFRFSVVLAEPTLQRGLTPRHGCGEIPLCLPLPESDAWPV